jgi:Cu-Zn family superoxide dismutase
MKAKLAVVFLFVFLLVACSSVWAEEIVVDMHALTLEGIGEKIGTISISETEYGTLITPKLSWLSPGLHGFHVHEKGSCDAAGKDGKMGPGLAAGGHYDPEKTGSHKGPYTNGHKGDLPALYVDSVGAAVLPVLAPRIKLSELKGHALMIHQGGDNYSDTPEKLGGGGDRAACGVVK